MVYLIHIEVGFMFFVSLAVCNIEPLIEEVLNHLYKNTDTPFYLSIVDNASTDNTVDVIKGVLQGWGSNCVDCNLARISDRTPSTTPMNLSFKPLFEDLKGHEVTCVTKLDHDYGVPQHWDTVINEVFLYRPDVHLLCPSVVPETPKGMQYYSQKHQPESITTAGDHTLYHYTGIAGYAHTWRYKDFLRISGGTYRNVYKPLNTGVVFGSEDADMSLRCLNTWGKTTNAYIFDLQGWHWNKPIIGYYEDKWKTEATFNKTNLHWEEWSKLNVPKELL